MASREELEKLTGEQLDEIVHDMKAGEAAAINNGGEEAQIEFILEPSPPRWVNVSVRGGVAEVERSGDGVRVEVLDYDNDGCHCIPDGDDHSHEIFEAW